MGSRTKLATCQPCRKYQRARHYGVDADAIVKLAATVARLERAMYQMRADYRRVYKMAYERGAAAAKKRIVCEIEPQFVDESELEQMSHIYDCE